MNPKLPSRIMLPGLLALGISVAAKQSSFLSALGQSSIFEWGCGIVTALSFSAGMFLSLCGLMGRKDRGRLFFALHLLGLLTFCSMLSLYFLGYVVMTRIYYEPVRPDILPKLVENARTADSEKAREKMAEDAYMIYGLTLAYRLDNGELAYYQPTGEDAAFRDKYEKDNAMNLGMMQSLKEQLHQYPWLFSFYLGSFFSVYLAGTLWFLIKKSEPRP